MSRTDQLKQRVFANGGGNPEAPEAPAGNVRAPSAVDTLAKFLQSDAIQRQIAMALPRHLTPERASEANRETPRLDNRSGGVDPFDDEAESLTANESITKDHLYELLRAQLERAPSPEVVDMVLDEVATMPMGEARQSLEELGRERSAMMHK